MSENSRKKDVTTEIVVGAFMFTMLMVLLTITVVMSQNRFFEKTYTLRALFPNVGGLKEGEKVYLRGVEVGFVEDIEVSSENPGVEVFMRLDRPVTLYPEYRLHVESASALGGMRLTINEGDRSHSALEESDLQNLEGEPAPDLLGEANHLVKNLSAIASKIQSGEGTVGLLIQDDSLYREAETLVASLNTSASRLEEVSENARVITDRLVAGQGSLGKLFSEDETLYQEMTNTVQNLNLASADLREVFDRVEKGEGMIGKLLSPDDSVYRDLRDTMASLKSFSEDLGNQEGTVSRLLQDDTLYIKVEGLLDEARATIDDFRETSPITTFSTIFFGAF